jgi:hypothetical protein|tara:strand:+ start:8396 stop:8635 length:240 start_codon:yes stop_codon:yes gene_type:complete
MTYRIITPTNYSIKESVNVNKPLQVFFNPKEDITAYELALCLKLMREKQMVYDTDIDLNQRFTSYLRHFDITNPNEPKK